jgi:hypothetical protein
VPDEEIIGAAAVHELLSAWRDGLAARGPVTVSAWAPGSSSPTTA